MALVVPELGAPPGHSATSEAVVGRFFANQSAVDLLVKIMSKVVDEGERFLVLVDRKGRHRSKVAALILEDALNMLITPSGGRAVNAKTFDTFSARSGNQVLDDRLRGMRLWIEEPWHIMRGGPKTVDHRFGWSSASNSAESWDGFVAWHTHLEGRFWCVPEGARFTVEVAGLLQPRPSSTPMAMGSPYPTTEAPATPMTPPPIAVSTPPAFHTPPVALAAACAHSPPTDLPPSAPMPPPPPKVETNQWLASSVPTPRGSVAAMPPPPIASHNKIDPSIVVGCQPSPADPRIAPSVAPTTGDMVEVDDDWGSAWPGSSTVDPAAAARSSAPTTDARPAPEVESPVDISGTGRIASRKRFRWQSFEPRVELWEETLEAWGVDDRARQSLYLLAQHSREGYELANDIVSKLVKKIADRLWAHNPSGFVQTAARNARHRLSERPF